MLQGLRGVDDLPFARLFHGQQLKYFWENDSGEAHRPSRGRYDAIAVLIWSASRSRRSVPQFIPWRIFVRIFG